MSETATPAVKAKKSVALSGVTAGNTALCTVGKTGNDLHYRGYDILDIAEVCEFEEIARENAERHNPRSKSWFDRMREFFTGETQ